MSVPRLSRDHYGAALLVLLGIGAVVAGQGYNIGSLNFMGSGYIPVVLGVLCIGLGLVVAVTADPPTDDSELPDMRGGLCILGGVMSFVLFGVYGGFVPAAFASVFISALGDRQNSVRDAALLACAMAVAGVLIFKIGLNLQMPLFSWG